MKINAPYVIFYDDEHIRSQLQILRGELPTHFIRRNFSEFRIDLQYKSHWIHEDNVPSQELGMIWLEKVYMISEACNLNIFKTAWFAWVDAGIACYRGEAPPPTGNFYFSVSYTL